MSDKIESGYGYLLIDTPELKEKFGPKREGDEVCCHGGHGWLPVREFGDPIFFRDYKYRRPLVPPNDSVWELVPLGEVPPDSGVEWTSDGVQWWSRQNHGNHTVEEQIRRLSQCIAVRRRKQSQARWVSVKERLPDKYPVWVLNYPEVEYSRKPYEKTRGMVGIPFTDSRTVGWDNSVTHWQPATIPAPPQPPAPEKTDAEKCFLAMVDKLPAIVAMHPSACESAVNFTLAWQKGQSK